MAYRFSELDEYGAYGWIKLTPKEKREQLRRARQYREEQQLRKKKQREIADAKEAERLRAIGKHETKRLKPFGALIKQSKENNYQNKSN